MGYRVGGRAHAVGLAASGAWWWTAMWCCIGVALAGPEWVPSAWTREDGPVEYTGFACFLVGSVLAFLAASRSRPARRWVVGCAVLGVVMFVAAGEEISWGQRLLEVETPELLVDESRQDELNLHNIDGLQQKAVFAQLAVAGAGLLVARFVSRPWARVGLPFFAAYLAYRCARGIAAVAGWGPANRNAEVAELGLAVGLLVLVARLVTDLRGAGSRRLPGLPMPG
jgi:hypothetical protein